MAGDGFLSLDNVEHALRSEFLCQVLTQGAVKARVLGQSLNLDLPTSAMLCATGNGTAPGHGVLAETREANVRLLFHLSGRDTGRSVQLGTTKSHMMPVPYTEFTKSAQSSGPENMGPERLILEIRR